MCLFPALFLIIVIFAYVHAEAPSGSVVVFSKGEGGYYCHKIPYLLRTSANTLIAMAEARGKDGREACDDFSVSIKHSSLFSYCKWRLCSFQSMQLMSECIILFLEIKIGYRFGVQTKY